MRRFLFLPVVLCLAFLLSGCSQQPASETETAPKAVEPVSGQTALFRMYQVARSWAPDAQILKMNSILVSDVPEVKGKAGAWQVTFASESRSAARTYTYSVIETEPNLHLGVFPGPEESWSPASEAKAFYISAVKIDTDAAYQTALSHAKEAAAKQRATTIAFLLEKRGRFTNATWRVVWGESVGTAGLSVYVDATTGDYLETMH